MRKSNPDFSEGVAVGFMACAIICVIFIAIILHIKNDLVGSAVNLLTVLATLFAAFFAVHGIREQIQSNLGIENERRRKSLQAAKAVLPLALADISRVANNNMRRHFPPIGLFRTKITGEFENIDAELISDLRTVIEFAPDDVVARLSKIIACYQVLHSRNASTSFIVLSPEPHDWLYNEHLTIGDAINWAVVYAMVGSLYQFARSERYGELELINLDLLQSSFRNGGVNYEMFDKLMETMELRAAKGDLEMDFEHDQG